ncbi:MAG: response regulator transcription factor [Elusimicrobia bacterium]|nr:response regulator transcription factor [Elusimicrobiota bacterium]
MAYRILIIDDDPLICELVEKTLKREGFATNWVNSAEDGLVELRQSQYDLIVMDVGLPGLSGIKTCEILRQNPATSQIPIIMLTAEDSEKAKVTGLRTGADDYVTKPLSPAEFTARVHAVLRRVKQAGQPSRVFEAGGIRVDVERHEVFLKGKPVELRKKEFDLLCLFLERKERVLTRQAILEALWGDQVITEHTLEVHINNLREKLASLSHCLKTIPGVGYKFQP